MILMLDISKPSRLPLVVCRHDVVPMFVCMSISLAVILGFICDLDLREKGRLGMGKG